MYSRESYFDPTEVPPETYRSLAKSIMEELTSRLGDFSEPTARLKGMIRARLRLESINNHLRADKVMYLLAHEIEDLGVRVRGYQYIERYHFGFQSLSKEMGISFRRHAYEMRHAEVYSIKERAVKLLAFAYEVAIHFGIDAQPETRNFSNNFDRQMEYRLRERHRATHSHEAPSLASRTLQITSSFSDLPNSKEAMGAVLDVLAPIIQTAKELVSAEHPEDFVRIYVSAVDKEAAAMWGLFERYLRSTMKLSTEAPSGVDAR